MAKYKNDLKSALAHLEEIQAQKDAEERRKQEEENRKRRELEMKAAEKARREFELAEKQKLEELQKDCSNLYSWAVYYETYSMECGIVWAENFVEACQIVKKNYPNGKNYIVNPVKCNKRIERIAEYVE